MRAYRALVRRWHRAYDGPASTGMGVGQQPSTHPPRGHVASGSIPEGVERPGPYRKAATKGRGPNPTRWPALDEIHLVDRLTVMHISMTRNDNAASSTAETLAYLLETISH